MLPSPPGWPAASCAADVARTSCRWFPLRWLDVRPSAVLLRRSGAARRFRKSLYATCQRENRNNSAMMLRVKAGPPTKHQNSVPMENGKSARIPTACWGILDTTVAQVGK
jgi:hypothetical protein